MSALRAVHHLGLHVMDLAVSERFYVDLVGCEPLFSWNPRAPYISELTGYPDVDLHALILRMPATDICLELLEYRSVDQQPARADLAQPGTAHLAFFVDDVAQVFAKWTALGVQSVSAPLTPTIGPNKGGTVVYMLDPDGYRIELIQSTGSFADFVES